MVKTTKTKSTAPVASKQKTAGLKARYFDTTGKDLERMALPAVFSTPVNERLLGIAVRVYQANLRQGTKSTKTRGEVTGSTRKIYRQKGTGRARHGDIKAPVFVGGGIVFGPKPIDYSLKFPQKARRKSLAGALAQKAAADKIFVIANLNKISGKTKEMASLLKNIGLTDKSNLLVLTPELKKVVQAGRNITTLKMRSVASLSVYDVLKAENLLIADEALKSLAIQS